MNDLEMAAKFRAAGALIERNGWWDGGPAQHLGIKCALSALTDVTATQGLDTLILAAKAQERVGVDWLPDWNDEPGRTKEDVIALFEGLAHDLELRHQIAVSTPAESSHKAILPTLKEAVPVG